MSSRILPDGSEAIAKGEAILWEGRPLVSGLARQLFHVRVIIGYFAVLSIWTLASAHADGLRANAALIALAWTALPAAAAVAVVYAAAWLLALTTHYTVTDRRVILQIGVAMPIALTLPLRQIASADVKLYSDGSGDIPLSLGDQKLAYLLVWPHARPWRFKKPEPMLRAVPDAGAVATILSRALLKVSPQGEAIAIAPQHRPEIHREPGIAAA